MKSGACGPLAKVGFGGLGAEQTVRQNARGPLSNRCKPAAIAGNYHS